MGEPSSQSGITVIELDPNGGTLTDAEFEALDGDNAKAFIYTQLLYKSFDAALGIIYQTLVFESGSWRVIQCEIDKTDKTYTVTTKQVTPYIPAITGVSSGDEITDENALAAFANKTPVDVNGARMYYQGEYSGGYEYLNVTLSGTSIHLNLAQFDTTAHTLTFNTADVVGQ